jgi:hypothetical protein
MLFVELDYLLALLQLLYHHSHALLNILFNFLVSFLQRHYFMRFMESRNIEAAHTEWFFISETVHGLNIIVLVALG